MGAEGRILPDYFIHSEQSYIFLKLVLYVRSSASWEFILHTMKSKESGKPGPVLSFIIPWLLWYA